MIRAFVSGQTLRLSQSRVVADTIDYLVARFLFTGADWNGLEKWMHLQQGEYHYAIKLTDDQTRREDHLNLTEGQWLIWLHGNEVVDGEVTERITTNVCAFTVEATGALEGEVMPPVAPEMAEQLDARMTAIEREQATEVHLPAVGAADEGKLLQVVGGEWKAAQDMQTAVDGALSKAKESGLFDGKDGHDGADGRDGGSMTVSAVSESGEDGGENVVTFSDGNRLTVRNGKRGAQGPTGPMGASPRLRVNSQTDEWECSYDDGASWESLGVKATATPAFSEEDKLDPKYIDAEWMATKTQEGGSVELEMDVAFTSSYVPLGVQWAPEVGFDAYDVYWNGEKYECTLVTANGEAFLGNRSLIDGAYADTGEPFVLTGWALTDKDPVLTAVKKATSDAQTVHIKVTTHAVVTYSQLPAEYMTQALPYYVDVLVSYSSDTGGYVYSCTERVERLEPMVRSGRTVRMRMTMGEDGVYQGALLCELGAYTESYGGLALVFTQVIPLLGTNMFMLAPDGAGGYVVSDEV